MGKNNKVTKNFAVQASILAIASIMSKLLGMVYSIVFTYILTKEGNGYYGTAQSVYYIILVIATFSIPSAVSKIMAEHIEKGQYRNVKRIFNCAMIYVLVVGGIASIITYVFAPVMVKEVSNATLSLRILAPTIFISGFLSVYRGYFQAYGNMVPTSISQIVEQIFNVVVSIVAALVFMKWATANGMGDQIQKYGSAGGTLGTGIACLAGLIYMMVLFQKEKKTLYANIQNDNTGSIMSYRDGFKVLLMIATPIIFSSFIYNVNVSLDMKIYMATMENMGVGATELAGSYALYSRYYLVLANVPIAMATAISSAIIPGVSSAFAVNNIAECKRKVQQGMQLTLVLTAPCAIGFATLGKPIVNLLFKRLADSDAQIVANLLLLGGISIVFYGISGVLNSVLQGIGKVNVPVISAFIALVLHLFILYPMMKVFNLGVYALILATAAYALIVVIVNYIVMARTLQYKMEWKQTVGVPFLSAIVMGVVVLFAYKGLDFVLSKALGAYISNAVATLVSVLLAIVVYFTAMIKVGGYTREMLLAFPKGTLLVKVAEKLHLIKG